MNICLIVAMTMEGVIGKDNKLPWHYPNDLKHFKKLTEHHAVIMGRKTFESLSKPLSNRINIVLTHNKEYTARGAYIAHTVKEAFDIAKTYTGTKDIYFIGGASIYELALPYVNKQYVTCINKKYEGDTYFDLNGTGWTLLDAVVHPKDDKHPSSYSFITYTKSNKKKGN